MTTIKELLEMELHEVYVFNNRTVIRVPGGWVYETEVCLDGVYQTDMITSCFVPEPSLQAIEPDFPEYDKTFEAERDFLTMGRFS